MVSDLTQPAVAELVSVLAFNASNQLAVRRAGTKTGLAFVGADLAMALARLEAHFKEHTSPAEYFTVAHQEVKYRIFFSQVAGVPSDDEVHFASLDELQAATKAACAL